jgi:hypothetical protein
MLDKLKQLYNYLHNRGFKFPLLNDPNTDQPSVTLTMMVISFVFCLAGLFQKLNNTDLDIDMSQALVLLTITSSLYLGHKISTNTVTKDITEIKNITTDVSQKENNQ